MVTLVLFLTTAGVFGVYVFKVRNLKESLGPVRRASSTPWPTLAPIPTSVSQQGPSPTPFLPSTPTLTPTPALPLKDISLLPTGDWRAVANNGISFKIPPYAHCNDENNCTLVSYTWDYQGRKIPASIKLNVSDFEGDSRREQFLRTHTETSYCRPIYKEAMFGDVKALQIAIDGGWCQSGGGGIVTVVGNKFVVFEGLTYDSDQKIERWSVRDTIISTLKKVI